MTKIGGPEGLRVAPDELYDAGMTEALARKAGRSKGLGSGAVATLETFTRMARGRLQQLLGTNERIAGHPGSRTAKNSKGEMVGVEASRFAPPERAITAVQTHPEIDPQTGIISPFAQGSGEVPPAVNSAHAVPRRVGGEGPIGIDMVSTGERGLGLNNEPIGPMIEVPEEVRKRAVAVEAAIAADAAALRAKSEEIRLAVEPAPGVDSPESTK